MRSSNIFRFFAVMTIVTTFLGCSSDSKSITFNPSTLNFNQVNIGAIKSETVVITNKLGKTALLTDIDLTGAPEFSIKSSVLLPVELENNEQYSITIDFEPTQAIDFSATLMVTNDVSDKTHSLNMSGTGFAVPRISVAPDHYHFGIVYYNTSKNQDFTITNLGTANLNISSLSFTGTNASLFKVVAGGSTPFDIMPGLTHKVTVEFLPTTAGIYAADLNIMHDAVNEVAPMIIPLQGDGTMTAAEFTLNHTAPWNLGDCSLNYKSTQALELTSNGLFDLNVTGATLQTSAEFKIKEIQDNNGNPVNLPQLVPIGDKLSIIIEFEPTSKQKFTDMLTISHDATNHSQPLNLNISGTGVDVRSKTFKFTGSSQTWTVPNGVTEALVVAVGGGGGGSGSHYGGGGSGYVIVKKVNVSGTIQIDIGEGGKGGITSTNVSPGGDGKDTTFGTLITATGGKGGGAYTYTYQTGGDGGSGGGGAGNMGSGGDGGSAGSNGLPGNTYAGGKGGHFDSLVPFMGTLTAGKGGAAGTSTHCGGGGAGGLLISGAGPNAGDGGQSWSGKGGVGYGAGGGSGGYDSGTRPGGGKGADGVIYIEY